MKIIKPLIVAALIVASQIAVSADNGCKKLVFNRFCLGGDISTELKNNPPSDSRKTGSKTTHYHKVGDNFVMIVEYSGRVMTVAKMMTNPSWMLYGDYEGRLTEQYGKPEDRSFYPDNATTLDNRETAINIGKGRALSTWKQDGWRIDLQWATRNAVSLFYIDTAVKEELDRSNNEGL